MKILVDGQILTSPDAYRGIGVYFRRVLTGMMENDLSSEWYITLADDSVLSVFKPWMRDRLRPAAQPEFDTGQLGMADFEQARSMYTLALEKIIRREKINLYWHPNPLMLNMCLPLGLREARRLITLFDLIPMIFRSQYLDLWPATLVKEYTYRLESLSSWADAILFISEATRADYESYIGSPPPGSRVIHLGVDSTRFRPARFPPPTFFSPYILFTGGFDYRKNMENALRAFTHLVHRLRAPGIPEDLKFIVVCAYTPAEKSAYEALAQSLGVQDRVTLTGYIGDLELERLYRNARAFFFPSRYEGFGLPILEAMACGIPVVTTDVASLSEVGGKFPYYCGPEDIEGMAIQLSAAITERGKFRTQRSGGVHHARQFTWAQTALRTLDAFRSASSRMATNLSRSKPRIAYVSPLPSQRTDVVTYSKGVLPHLRRYCDIDVFADDFAPRRRIKEGLACHPLSQLHSSYDMYGAVLYEIGNSPEFYTNIYRQAWNLPGVVILHDYNIHTSLRAAFLGSQEEELYRLALTQGYGTRGEEHYLNIKEESTEAGILVFPLSHALVKRSRATIVHHLWVREQFDRDLPVIVLPYGASPTRANPDSRKLADFSFRYQIPGNSFVITSCESTNPHARPEKILQAVHRLRNKGYPVHLLFAGDMSSSADLIRQETDRLTLSDCCTITGRLSDDDYETALDVSDIIVHLRYPSMGEAPNTLIRGMSKGKSALVSNVDQYGEFPDKVCWKVDVGETEVELLVGYMETLLQDVQVRNSLGSNALQFVRNVLSFENIAFELFNVVMDVGLRGAGRADRGA